MTNLLNIKTSDATIGPGKIKKQQNETLEVKAVKSVKEVKNDGKIIVKSEKAVKRILAKKEQEKGQFMHIFCKSKEISFEIIKRMSEQNLKPFNNMTPELQKEKMSSWPVIGMFRIDYFNENRSVIQKAFKRCKGKGDLNAPDLKEIKVNKKLKKTKIEKVKKEKVKSKVKSLKKEIKSKKVVQNETNIAIEKRLR